MKHIVRLFLCAALLLTVLFIQTAQAEPEPVRCVPGETIEVSFVLPDSAGGAAGMMGTLRYDYSVFTLLPSPGVIGQNGVYISSQPVSLAFAVNQYAPVGEYAIEVTVLEAYYADGHLSEITEIEPVPVSVVPAGYSVRYESGAEDSGIRDIPAPQEKAFREPLTLSGVRPARAGYDFMGWAASAGGKAVYQPGDAYQNDQDVTLYAVWLPIPTGRLAVDGWLDDNKNANGTGGYGTFDVYINGKLVKDDVTGFSEDVPAGCTYEIRDIRAASDRAYISAAEGSLQGAVASGQTVHVRLRFLSTYQIQFNRNTADSVSGMPSAQTKQYGQSLTLNSQVPVRAGYDFQGWALSAAGSVQYKAGSAYAENKNLTLYAVWAGKPVMLDVNGWLDDQYNAGWINGYGSFDMYDNGQLLRSNVSDFYEAVPVGSTYEIKNIQETSGHFFDSVTEGSLKGTITSETTVNIRLRFYSYYDVYYDKNTSDYVYNMPSIQRKKANEIIRLSSNTPSRTGYEFQGWALTTNGSVRYQPGSSFSENKNTTLYAIWKSTVNSPKTTSAANTSSTQTTSSQQTSKLFESLHISISQRYQNNAKQSSSCSVMIHLKGIKKNFTVKNVTVSWDRSKLNVSAADGYGEKTFSVQLPNKAMNSEKHTIRFQCGTETVTVTLQLTYKSGQWGIQFLGYTVSSK